jgi:hypothetical protein
MRSTDAIHVGFLSSLTIVNEGSSLTIINDETSLQGGEVAEKVLQRLQMLFKIVAWYRENN